MLLLVTQFIHAPIFQCDFSKSTQLKKWKVVNDGVMGGQSNGSFDLTEKGHALFKGTVSLENNGGFTSVCWKFDTVNIRGAKVAKIRLKGDGKNYQFRVKERPNERHSYKYEFETSGDWETIEIPLTEMTPTYRGMQPAMPNFSVEMLGEIGFLIANKKNEQFELLIDRVWFV